MFSQSIFAKYSTHKVYVMDLRERLESEIIDVQEVVWRDKYTRYLNGDIHSNVFESKQAKDFVSSIENACKITVIPIYSVH